MPDGSNQPVWYMYVVECIDGTLYTGMTTDVKRRLYEHNNTARGAKYTRPRRPVVLVHVEEFESRSSAAKAEAAFKKLSRRQKQARLKYT